MSNDPLLDRIGEYLFSWAPIPGKLPWSELPDMSKTVWLMRAERIVAMVRAG